MRKASIRVSILFMFLVSLTLIMPYPVYSSPGATTYNSYPTNHVDSGITSSPLLAYDKDNDTFATVNRGSDGTFDVQNFTKPTIFPGMAPPSAVDIKMRYSADVGNDDKYQIEYDLGSGNWVILVGWTATGTSLATYTWSSVARPGGGSWAWDDLLNLRLRVATDRKTGDDKADFYEYEAWATVHYTSPQMYVYPASQSVSTSFSIDIKASGVTDFYGWEFKLYYDTSIITCPGTSNVTEGAFLATGGTTFYSVIEVSDAYNATHGRVWATCTLLGDVAGVSGSGTIATISFDIDANGDSDLDLQDTKMVGYDKPNTQTFAIPHTAVDGTVNVTGAVPEFALGAAMEIALAVVIVYFWWKRKHKGKPSNLSTPPFR